MTGATTDGDRMETTLLAHAHRIDATGEAPDSWILFDGPVIAAAGVGEPPSADRVVDLAGLVVVPGFLDLHVHGGGGHGYDDGVESIRAGLADQRRHGTTRSLVSLVANPVEALRTSLAGIARLAREDPLVLGSHLEGPFLSPAQPGAHHPEYLREPDRATVEALLEAADGTLRQMTIAPELPGALEAIGEIAAAGVVPAVGHTAATYDQARAAFDAGARILTHAFNAMRGIHHREPGPLVAAFEDERVVLELILDGLHVHTPVAAIALAQAPHRVALVTDAMAAAGAADGDYRLGSLNVSVRDGLALLSGTPTIAGSTLTQDLALRIAVERVGLPPAAAVEALTLTPARALGLADRLGLLAAGYAADAVVLDRGWRVRQVWAAGEPLGDLPVSFVTRAR